MLRFIFYIIIDPNKLICILPLKNINCLEWVLCGLQRLANKIQQLFTLSSIIAALQPDTLTSCDVPSWKQQLKVAYCFAHLCWEHVLSSKHLSLTWWYEAGLYLQSAKGSILISSVCGVLMWILITRSSIYALFQNSDHFCSHSLHCSAKCDC